MASQNVLVKDLQGVETLGASHSFEALVGLTRYPRWQVR
jgi:hypothetical protein